MVRRGPRRSARTLAVGGVCIACGFGLAAWVLSTRGAPQPTVRRPITKLLVVVVENHSFDQMKRQMPYVRDLAAAYGYADQYYALTHPSLPNYLAIAGGDTFGVDDDHPPSEHRLSGPTVFGEAVEAGRTARIYADGMSENCQHENHDRYAVKHNPWPYFVDEASHCGRDDVALSALTADAAAGRLPAVGMVVPDLCHDAHDCSLAEADSWTRSQVGAVLRGPDWRSGSLAVIITADEDDKHHGNRILTVVAHPRLHHVVVHSHLDHYSLSRAYAEVAQVEPLRNARRSRSLLEAFGLEAG